jgi:plastocyanin
MFRKPSKTTVIIALVALFSGFAIAVTEHVVSQKGKAFSLKKLSIHVGDTVKFLNEDPFSHNIFSLSETKSFDLGTYPQGQARNVTFDKPGTVEVECAIHPEMKMSIEVSK